MSGYLGLEYTDWSAFDRAIETAKQRKLIADVMDAADNFLHTIFEAGAEPKWSHECQRESLMTLRSALLPLGENIGVLNAEGVRKMDAFKASTKRSKL